MSASRLPPPQWLEPCAPAQFSATLLNTGSGTATGTLQLNHQLGSSMLSLTVGGTVQPTTAPIIYNLPQGASLTVQYTMQVGCEGLQPLFANNGTLLPLLFTESATAGGASVQASYQVRYPFVVRDALAASNAGLFTTAHRGMVLGRTLEFSNDGLGAFNGTFLATATQGCQHLLANGWTASLQGPQGQLAPVNNINVTAQGVELNFAAQPWPAGWRLLLTEQVEVTGCLDLCPNGTANTAYAFNLSCTATTCLPLSPAGASVQRDNARPLLANYRVQPAGVHPLACLPAGLDSSRLHHHRHHLVNLGNADAKDIKLRLSNTIDGNIVNGNTFLLGNTVQFSHGGQAIAPDIVGPLITPGNYPACVQALVQAGHNPIARYDMQTFPWLAPGDSIVVDFYTYRCCPDTASTLTGGFDKPEYFDNWTVGWDGDRPMVDECDGQGEKLAYDLQDLAAGRYPSDEPRARYLHLQQAFYPTVTQLLGPFTTGTCGTNPTVLQVQNMSFNAGLGEADGNHLFFGSNAGATPAGQLLLRVSTTQGLSFLPGTALLSDGNAPLVYTVQAAPQGQHHGTWEILFDLPALFNDYAALRYYMEHSSLYLPVVPCCPSGGSTARVQAELVLLQGGGNCPACQVALSRVYHDIIIQCPGCVTPGVIVDDVQARRLNFGLVDTDNDGIPDQPLATLQPGPGSTAPDRSMQGDTVRVTVQAFGQEGDAGNGGFTYAQWAQVHGESLRWLNLDLVNPCAWQDTFDWVGISDSLRVWQDNGWGNWIDLSTWRTRVGKQYQYRLPGDVLYAQGLLQRPHFKPGDQYEFRLDYRVCGNYHSDAEHQLACGITAICWWSGVQQGPNARGQRQKAGDYNATLPPATSATNRATACGLDLLYYCEANGTNHFNLGWRQHVTAYWSNLAGGNRTSCDKVYFFRVRRHLGVLDDYNIRNWLPGNSANPFRYFPGEYRPLRHDPRLLEWSSPQGYTLSQAESESRSVSRYIHTNGSLVTWGCNLSQLPGVYSAQAGQEVLDLTQGAPLAFVPLENTACAGTALYSSDEFLEYSFSLVYKPDTCLATDYTVQDHGELAFTGTACTATEELAGGSGSTPLYYPRPGLQVLNQQASLVLGSNPTATGFQVRNAPTPPSTPGGSGPAEHVFVQLQPPAGISVLNLAWTATGNNQPFQAVTGQHLLFTHPRLDRGASWVHACSFELLLDSCTATPDSIMVRFGWQCHGPLLDAGLAACWEDTAWIQVVPALPTLLPGDMTSGPLVACDTVRVSSCTYSTNTGLVNQFSFELHLPPGATLMPGSVTASIDDIPPLVTGPLQAVSNQGDSVYTFVLDPAWGLAGTPSAPLCVNFVFDYMPGCNPGPTALPWLLVRGISFCGDTLGVVLQRLDSLPLAGDNCVPLDVQLQSITAAGCNGGGAIDITASGEPPLQYSWTGPNGFSASTANIYNLQAGLYQLVLTDLRGCSLTAQYTVPLDSLPNLWLEANASCVGQQLLISVQGDLLPGYTYSWAGPNGPIVASGPDYSVAQASLQDAGLYSVTVSAPGAGCAVLQAQVQVWMNCCGLGYTEVGSLVGVPDIGTAIGSNLMLPYNQSHTQAQSIVVRGTFEFNSSTSNQSAATYSFMPGSEIIMDAGAEIIIRRANGVHMVGTTVTGCDTFWRSITVYEAAWLKGKNNRFEGGEYAINLMAQSMMDMNDSRFSRNHVGVAVVQPGVNTLHMFNLAGNEFGEQTPLPVQGPLPYIGMTQGRTVAHAGIQLHDVPWVQVDGGTTNTFKNMAHGILARRHGRMRVALARFDNITRSAIQADGWGLGSELVVDGNAGPGPGTVSYGHQAPGKFSTFVQVTASNLLVEGCTVERANVGVNASLMTGCHAEVRDNEILAKTLGILVLNLDGTGPNPFAFSMFSGNRVEVYGEGGVGISLAGCTQPAWVLQNSVYLDTLDQVGINVLHSDNAGLFLSSNDVHMRLPGGLQAIGHNNLPKYGINVESSDNVNVDCNHVLGALNYPRVNGLAHLQPASWQGLERYVGYRQSSSLGTQVSCNLLDNLRVCALFTTSNLNSNVQGNVFDQANQVGLWVKSGSIGPQENRGNLWTGTFDQGPPGQGTGFAAWNSAGPGSSILLDPNIPGVQLNPSGSMYPLLPPFVMFLQIATQPFYYCPSDNWICQSYTTAARQAGGYSPLDSLVAQGDLAYTYFNEELNTWDDKKLYGKLVDDDNPGGDLADFKLAYEQAASYDDQLLLDKHAAILVQADSTVYPLLDNVKLYRDSLDTKLEALKGSTVQADSLLILGDLARLNEQLGLLVYNLDSLLLHNKSLQTQGMDLLKGEALLLAVTDYQELIYKTAQGIYLASVAKGQAPDSLQGEALLDLVDLCPVVAGPGVYLARSLYAYLEHRVYQDEATCWQQGVLMREAPPQLSPGQEGGLSLYPNPGTGLYKLEQLAGQAIVSARLFSLAGQAQEAKLEGLGSSSLKLDATTLPEGLYLLEVELADQSVHRLKLLKHGN